VNTIEGNPFYPHRHKIVAECKGLIKTGDIFYRHTNVIVFGFIPFSRLVAYFTNSIHSHASVALVENKEVYILEVNELGTIQMRLIDWIDYCWGEEILVCRIKGLDEGKIGEEIKKFLVEDPDYDFLFSDSAKYYCTEAVNYIYEKVGIKLMEPIPIRDMTPWWFYYLVFSPINLFLRVLFKAGFDPKNKYYFVGNKEKGMLANPNSEVIYKFQAPK
jgi:hypothetical protein